MRARIRAATFVGAALVTVAAFAAAPAALGAAPAASAAAAAPAATQTISNIAYAPAQPAGSRGHLLDLYMPSGSTTPRPLVIWTGGSAWMSDDGKSTASSIAATFNAKGYAVAGVSVRSSSQAVFPAQVYDIKAAIRWLRANAATYQLDPNRFAVMGDSSGGWETDMATLTAGVASLEGNIGTTGVSSAVQAGVSFFGPTDFLQMNSERLPGGLDHDAANSPESLLMGCAIQTCPDKVEQANPITYVDQNDPPMMLLHGQADQLVPHGQSVLLYNALKAKCDKAQFFSVPGAGHGTADVLSTSRYGTQTVYTTSACQSTTSTGTPNPSWDTIADFLNTALNIGGGTTTGGTTTGGTTTGGTTTGGTTTGGTTTGGTTTGGTTAGGTTTGGTTGGTGGAACRVTYTANTWDTGFTAGITVTNTGSTPVNGWTLQWTWPGNQQVTSAWSATVTQSGSQVTARNVDYDAAIAAGAGVNFGFQASYSGTNAAPTQFALNGTACATS